MRTEGLITSNGFDIQKWRSLLANAAIDQDCGDFTLEVINPFGFEILNDKEFLNRNLKRFYCYIGAANKFNEPSILLATSFLDSLYKHISSYDNRFAEDIILLVVESDSIKKTYLKDVSYTPKWDDKVIIVEHRVFNESLISDYADYLISTLFGFKTRNLPELLRFREYQTVRNRVFQLYIIIENLFSEFVRSINEEEADVLKRRYYMKSIDVGYYYKGKELQQPTSEEIHDMSIILNRVDAIFNDVCQYTDSKLDVVSKTIKSYNSGDFLKFTLDRNMYNSIKTKVTYSYYNI
jgi:hypothetical protein